MAKERDGESKEKKNLPINKIMRKYLHLGGTLPIAVMFKRLSSPWVSSYASNVSFYLKGHNPTCSQRD